MKLTSKIVTVVAVSMMIAQVVCPTEQKIVAYKAKGMNLGQGSAIQLWQDSKIVSASTFGTATDKKTAGLVKTSFYPKGKTSLYFIKGKPVTIAYNFFGSNEIPGQASGVDTPLSNETKPLPTQKTFQPNEIPGKSKIKVSIGAGGSSQAHPFNIDIEPALVRVNVKKVMTTLPDSAKIIALKEKIGTSDKPKPNQIYDTILAKNTSTRKLKVPFGKAFWISVPITKQLNEITEMPAKEVTTSSVININDYSKAAWAN